MLSVVIRRRNSSTTTRGAPGDIHGQLLEREQRALAAPVADGVGDLGAAVGAGRGDLVDRVVADQVADVGDDPRRAGLDELVVVELLDVVLDDRRTARPARRTAPAAGRRWRRRASGRPQGAARRADRRSRLMTRAPMLPWVRIEQQHLGALRRDRAAGAQQRGSRPGGRVPAAAQRLQLHRDDARRSAE